MVAVCILLLLSSKQISINYLEFAISTLNRGFLLLNFRIKLASCSCCSPVVWLNLVTRTFLYHSLPHYLNTAQHNHILMKIRLNSVNSSATGTSEEPMPIPCLPLLSRHSLSHTFLHLQKTPGNLENISHS